MNLLQPLSAVVPRPISWLWPNRLALGKLAMFDGDPGLGKSLVALDLAARLSAGRPLPGCAQAPLPASVLILHGEDAGEDTVVPRLQAAGADLDRVFHFSREFIEQKGPLRLPSHTEFLESALAESRAALVIIDPIVAFLDASVQMQSDAGVRRALSPLAALAGAHACHILMIRHLNKTASRRALYRGGGSIGLLAACRSGFVFARDPLDATRCVIAQTKNNLASLQPSWSYRVEVRDGVPSVAWLGECDQRADDLLAAAGRKPCPPSPRARVRDFLYAFLDDGPRPTVEIWPAAKALGLSRATLRRVRKQDRLRRESVLVNNRRLTYWLLPGQQLPPDLAAADPECPSLEPYLAPLREQFPTTPLDEEG